MPVKKEKETKKKYRETHTFNDDGWMDQRNI